MWDSLGQMVRDAWRGLRKISGVSAAIVAMLALGIGANATMFRIVDRLLLSPPRHLVDPDRLRFVVGQRPTLTRFPQNLTYSDVTDLEGLPAFEAVAAYTDPQAWTYGVGAGARKVRVQLAEAVYFTMLVRTCTPARPAFSKRWVSRSRAAVPSSRPNMLTAPNPSA